MSADVLPATLLSRKAVVYVRQSTQTQVQTNLESKRRQYDLVEAPGARSNGPDGVGPDARVTEPSAGVPTEPIEIPVIGSLVKLLLVTVTGTVTVWPTPIGGTLAALTVRAPATSMFWAVAVDVWPSLVTTRRVML